MEKNNFLIILCFLFLTSCLFFNCSKEKQQKTEIEKIKEVDKTMKVPSRNNKIQTKKLKLREEIEIKELRFSPKIPVTDKSLTLEVSVETEDIENVNIRYIFYKNNELFQEGTDNVVMATEFEKGDVINAVVLIVKDGKIVKRVKSDIIKINNSTPEITDIMLPEINKPGNYTVKINASDIDKDILRYSLKGNYPPQTRVDNSGTIFLNLRKELFGNTYDFIVVVDDGEATVDQELKLKLFKKEGEITVEEQKKEQ